jgi:glycogen debranching enzyme GlgX/4-alpha-glucanotransferase
MTGRISEGSPEPLGLRLDERGANVAVYSANATAIELCLFDGDSEIERLRLPFRTGDVFHCHIEGVRAGRRYGFRAHGRHAPEEGHVFNPAKLLVDPYALALDRPFTFVPALLGETDSAPFTPKAIAIRPAAANPAPRARRPWAELIIYELHVRGFTKTRSDIPEAIRGTFAGLAHPAALQHLVKLGVTAVEIMPCAAWIDERHLQATGLSNYWGYNPVALMAPDPRLAPGGWDEIRTCVAALQGAGIEVILDVVLNHTGEGDALGPTLSLRGLDNTTYYRLTPGTPCILVNDTGCGNTLALDRPPVARLAMDALRTWAELGGVDGFRFDLAATMGRRDNGFDASAPLLTAICQDPLLRDLRLIAEPWDIGPGGYQIGAFPASWGEWNDKFRDAMRTFWRDGGGYAGEAVTRFAGSSDIFAPRRRPSRSVNFVVAHDGFTLADLVSYERKHNDANGEDGRDGTDANSSWNNGVEGPSDDPAITAARRRDQRNLLASLLLARGAPMLAMGSELGCSQRGNNNAYAQDNAVSWIDWEAADHALTSFTARLIALRGAHPALTRDRFLTGDAVDASLIPDVEWLTPDGSPMQPSDWANPNQRAVIAALYAPATQNDAADRIVVILHAGREPIDIVLPEARTGCCWRQCLDTAHETGDADLVMREGSAALTLSERSVVVFEEAAHEESDRARPQSGTASDLLDKLARAAGVAPDWHDIKGARHVAPDSTKQALLTDMGLAAGSNAQARESLGRLAEELDRRPLPLTLVVYDGEPITLRMPCGDGCAATALILQREDGGAASIRLTPANLEFATFTAVDGRRYDCVLAKLPPQPVGRHRIMLEHRPEIACCLTVAPRRCFLPDALASGRRAFGVAAQLYSVRRDGDQGIGDFTTLGQLAGMAGEARAAAVGVNPLHALFPFERDRASPYYPSDRRFIDPIYIDVAALALMDGGRASAALAGCANRIAELSAAPQVDYAGVWALKRAILAESFADFEAMCAQTPGAVLARDFDAFVVGGGSTLHQFACFQAISESRQGEPWARWPTGLAQREPRPMAAFAQENAATIRFHLYLQWLCDRQFADAAARGRESGLWLGFYRDLAVGAAPDGAEAWANAGQLLPSVSVGAPPDPIAEGGQNWGLQPPNPLAWRRTGYAVFNDMLAANMRHAGALRIDHAMGLTRLFVIPQGAPANEGAYLSYPVDDLIAHLALQSARAGCLVIGEDLGTVPEGFRDKMDAADILSYRVLWFERDERGFKPPEAYPVKSVACVSTHDLPPLAGWWRGEDIREKEALGLISPHDAAAARNERAADKAAFLRALGRPDLDGALDASTPLDPSIVAAAHDFTGRASSLLAMAQIDDLSGEVTAVNLPGTDQERPNWRRKLKETITDLPGRLAALPLR